MAYDIKFTSTQIKYLVFLHRLSPHGQGVKNAELSEELGISRPSVYSMVRSLSTMGFVEQKGFSLIYLTVPGRIIAEKYAISYRILELRIAEICQTEALHRPAVLCSLLANMPEEELDRLIAESETPFDAD